MIVVKLEMWPGGSAARAYELGRAYIHNVGGTAKRGNYDVAICRKGEYNARDALLGGALRVGEVKNYPRLSYNVWRLIIRALKSAFPEEK